MASSAIFCFYVTGGVFRKKKMDVPMRMTPNYGAQNEAYRMTEGRKMGEVVSLQTVRRSLMVEAPQNETFT